MHKLSIWKWRMPRLQQSIWIYSLLSNNLLLVLSIVHVFRWSVCDVKSWLYRKQPFVMAFSTLAVYCYCSLQISIQVSVFYSRCLWDTAKSIVILFLCIFFKTVTVRWLNEMWIFVFGQTKIKRNAHMDHATWIIDLSIDINEFSIGFVHENTNSCL